ncbi:hypothetical protein [Thalassobellus citreus]|uniref:hypothetical protein n=1 Tax=Thalassobellus citreus TaxID=3367752 RepID=UPI00379E6974
MRNLFVLIFVLTITLFNCNNRKTKSEALKESVTKFKDSISPIEIKKYFPEAYTEVETDTILNNGFHVKIKTFTDMKQNVLNAFTIDSINYKYYYRNYINKLEIFYNNKLIIDEYFNKSSFSKDEDTLFWKNALLGGFTLDDTNIDSDKVSIIAFYCPIESEDCKEYKITIDKEGNKTTEDITTELIH